MARYSLVVLKVPLNTNGPANQYFELGPTEVYVPSKIGHYLIVFL